MTNIILNGACGKMGTVIAKCVSKRDDCRVVCGVDLYSSDENSFPVVDDYEIFTLEELLPLSFGPQNLI